jgi:hypothetical protein
MVDKSLRIGQRLAITLAACVLGAYATALLVGNPLSVSLFGEPPAQVPLADFGSFYASGQAAGQGLDPYDVYPLTLDAVLGRGTGAAPNLNAPASLPLFQALTVLDVVGARRAWFVVTCVAYTLSIALLMRAYRGFRGPLVIAWCLAMTGFFETLMLGQVYAVLALLTTTAFLLLVQRRWLAAGVLIGCVVAFKPNLVVWPALLLLGGYIQAGTIALLAAAAFGVLPVALYGPAVYAQWVDALRLDQVNAQVANASLVAALVRVGATQGVGLAVGALVLGGLAVWVWRTRPPVATTSGVALVGALLASPLAWVGYTLFLLPIVARMRLTLALVIAGGLLCIPRIDLQTWANTSQLLTPSVGSAFTVAWLILLGHELLRLDRPTSAEPG